MIVFVVMHSHEIEDGEDDIKMIGVYSTQQQAEQAVERMLTKSGFCDTTEGFSITPYVVDQDHWTEGYETLIASE